ncbi:MAG: hypothetical protein JST49_09255 [Bacteroidetes bacterium]|nr:hypothetical protein [Bacteroidota bacterium]
MKKKDKYLRLTKKSNRFELRESSFHKKLTVLKNGKETIIITVGKKAKSETLSGIKFIIR